MEACLVLFIIAAILLPIVFGIHALRGEDW